ncbi:hypothetical protein VZC37_21995 [Gordonia sp. LSe1-13]|uniref:Uncharacterized protein n=1 Tax=Gordonia sesuvii TaxID=3116777 RepID=A0ABU7MIV0_9ACTN|nr:hypothetical protein [Gordonia sp. LSe1-13]
MTTTESAAAGVGDRPMNSAGGSIDAALREAIDTIDSTDYRHDNPAFGSLSGRDALVLGVLYVLLPVVLAIAVWIA